MDQTIQDQLLVGANIYLFSEMLILALGPPSFLFNGCQRFIHRCRVTRTWSWPLTAYSVKVKSEWRCTCMKAYGHFLFWPVHQSGLSHNKMPFFLPCLLVSSFLTSVHTYPCCSASPSILFFPHSLFVLQDWMLCSCHGRMPQRSQDTVETSAVQDWFHLSAFWKWHTENAD